MYITTLSALLLFYVNCAPASHLRCKTVTEMGRTIHVLRDEDEVITELCRLIEPAANDAICARNIFKIGLSGPTRSEYSSFADRRSLTSLICRRVLGKPVNESITEYID